MKKVKIITITLAIVLVTLVAFAGIYVQTQNRMENKVKDYTFSKEIDGGRIIDIIVKDTEDNTQEKTVENYQTVKNTIKNRLKNLRAQDYDISLNEEDGTIRVELPENKSTDTYAYYLTAQNKVQIKEKDAETEIINDSMIKKAHYSYNSNMNGEYQVYLELILNKEGQAKLEQETANYAFLSSEIEEIEAAQSETNGDTNSTENTEESTTEENMTEESTTEESTTENNAEEQAKTETKKIASLTIDETEYEIEKIDKNKLTIKIGGKTSNNTSVNNNMAKAAELTLLINSGKYPLNYEIENNRYVYSDLSKKQMTYFVLTVLAVLLVVLIAISIKYKGKGILCAISFVGFISVYSLILRYTNVLISIEGIGAIILTMLINLKLNKLILSKIKKMNMIEEAFNTTYKELAWKLIPIIIIAITFCFSGWTNLSSFGLVMFWGILLIPIYNILVTKTLLKIRENE